MNAVNSSRTFLMTGLLLVATSVGCGGDGDFTSSRLGNDSVVGSYTMADGTFTNLVLAAEVNDGQWTSTVTVDGQLFTSISLPTNATEEQIAAAVGAAGEIGKARIQSMNLSELDTRDIADGIVATFRHLHAEQPGPWSRAEGASVIARHSMVWTIMTQELPADLSADASECVYQGGDHCERDPSMTGYYEENLDPGISYPEREEIAYAVPYKCGESNPNCHGCCGGGFEPGDWCVWDAACWAHDKLCTNCGSWACGWGCVPDQQ